MNFELLAAAEGRPLNFSAMLQASAHAEISGPRGDAVKIWLKIAGGIIRKASFTSDGCEDSLICCSTVARLAEGMRLEDAAALTPDDILSQMPPIQAEHRYCAFLAANVMKKAIAAYMDKPAKVRLKQKLKSFKQHEIHHHGNPRQAPPSPGGKHV